MGVGKSGKGRSDLKNFNGIGISDPENLHVKDFQDAGTSNKNVKNRGKYGGGWGWEKVGRGGGIFKIPTESESLTPKTPIIEKKYKFFFFFFFTKCHR